MTFENVISFINDSIEEHLPSINSTIKKITGNELEISFSALNDSNSSNYFDENLTPFVSVNFSSKGTNHQIISSADNIEKLTELLGNRVSGELGEKHINILNKIGNSLQSSFSSAGLSFLGADIIKNSENINVSNHLKSQKLILKAGDDLLEINLYHWENQENNMEDSTLEVQQAKFGELGSPNGNTTENKIDMLLEVELDVTIELGRKKMTIQEVLQLGKGSVIELSKLAGEPVDIYVNQKRLAQGEVVVVDENFAIRITNLIEKSERLKSLGK